MMLGTNKLFRVTCRGMTGSLAGEQVHGVAYVVAPDPTTAYRKLRGHLDAKDLGFTHQRALSKVELIADEHEYGECGLLLMFADSVVVNPRA